VSRQTKGTMVHDGVVPWISGCPRGFNDCTAVARKASPGFESYMCCGETATSPVPTDVLRLCIKSSHDRKPVDLLVNLDRRDAIDVACVLLGGMSMLAQADAANAFAIAERPAGASDGAEQEGA
jgi:hypothetical protein